MIYLDNAATTPILPEVAETMMNVLTNDFGNPSSIHTIGRRASQILRESRHSISDLLNVNPREITFTSGGSEANNTAIIGYALKNRDKGNHILTTAIEHPSVLEAVKYLESRHGFDVTFVKPNADGSFTSDLIAKNLRDDTILVSVMAANNETGQLLPIVEIGQILAQHQAVFHVDAVQISGKIKIDVDKFGADFLSISGHKFHGPKGTGILYHRESVKFDKLIHGGDQEEKRRAGTENLHSIVGMTKAFELANANMEANFEHVSKLKTHLLSNLTSIEYYQNEFGQTLPHVINLAFPKQNHDLLLTKLDMRGIAISTGSACTAGTVEPSHVLESIYGKNSPKLKENIRVSLSELNTIDEINQFTETLKGVL